MVKEKEILRKHVSATPSKWREKAEWRRKNRLWLKKSQQIAVLIIACIEDSNMSQKELAKKMGVKPQYVSKILQGNSNLTLETISKLEAVLHLEIVSINRNSIVQELSSRIWVQQPMLTTIGVEMKSSFDYLSVQEYHCNLNLVA